MTDDDGRWERNVLEKLAMEALKEQRRSRRWGIFFKLLTFAYITFAVLLLVDWKAPAGSKEGRHTALVEISGVISPGSDSSAEKVVTALNAAFKDKGTQGVVLRINSPGGSPVQSQTIFDEMRRLRQKYPQIPLHAVVEDLCASGGYIAALASDHIIAQQTSLVGSIGVLVQFPDVSQLMKIVGVKKLRYIAE